MQKHGNIARFASFLWLVFYGSVSSPQTLAAGQTGAAKVQPESSKAQQPSAPEVPGSDSSGRNSFLPSISLTTRMRSDSRGLGYGGSAIESYLMGHLGLRRFTGRSGFMLDYAGGKSISTGSSGTSALVQALEFSQDVVGRRSTVSFGGAISYLPESSFGFGWGVGFSNPSVSGQSVDPHVNAIEPETAPPNQTILTARGQRLSSVLHARLEYRSSQRSSWTVSGSYGRLDFDGAGYVDSSDALLQAGYGYQWDRKDTVSVSYGFDGVRFADVSQSIDEHRIFVSFSRRVNDKLNLQVSAGPSLSAFRMPPAGAASQISYRVAGGVTYKTERGSLGLNYDRFLNGGSGVLMGAQTNQLQFQAVRLLTRTWEGATALGYAANRGFAETGAGSDQAPLRSWYSTTRLSRRLTRVSFFGGYGIRSQNNYGAVCAGPGCRLSFLTHEISLGLSWSLRPMTL